MNERYSANISKIIALEEKLYKCATKRNQVKYRGNTLLTEHSTCGFLVRIVIEPDIQTHKRTPIVIPSFLNRYADSCCALRKEPPYVQPVLSSSVLNSSRSKQTLD